MPDIKQIINELKSYLSIKTDSDFASYLGVSATALANWKARNTIDYELIYTKCDFVDANWLLTGKGNMLKAENHTLYDSNPPINSFPENVSIPIMDVRAAAGIGIYNDEHVEILGEISIPRHLVKQNHMHVVIRVKGESMAPTLLDSSYLIIRLLDKSEWEKMPNEHVYMICDMEGNNYVKRVRNRFDRGFIVLTSDNTDKINYSNFNLQVEEINTIWHAELYLSAKMPNINKTYYSELNQVKNDIEDIKSFLGQKTLTEFLNNKLSI